MLTRIPQTQFTTRTSGNATGPSVVDKCRWRLKDTYNNNCYVRFRTIFWLGGTLRIRHQGFSETAENGVGRSQIA